MSDTIVTVLMSTYNGEKYLEEQLESIFNQSYSGMIKILIRDDGSKDETIDIIKHSLPKPNREISLIEGNNIGPQRSFLELIKISEGSDYYFFADQDDVWDLDKIDIAVQYMEEGKKPCVYCSNYRLSDADLNIFNGEFLKKEPVFSPLKIIFYNEIPGCTMGFNSALMKKLKKLDIDNVMMHDSMVLSFGAFTGSIVYDPNSRITHRIHGSNVVGEGHAPIVLHKWVAEKIHLLFQKEDYSLSKMAEQFLESMDKDTNLEYVQDLELLRDFKKSWKNTIQLLKHPDSKNSLFDRTTLSIRCKILFHIF